MIVRVQKKAVEEIGVMEFVAPQDAAAVGDTEVASLLRSVADWLATEEPQDVYGISLDFDYQNGWTYLYLTVGRASF